jgi:hypothetical protein
VALLAALGAGRAVLHRDRGVVAAGTAAVVAVLVVVVTGSSWVELKAFTISAPLVVAVAFAGAAALGGPRWRRLEALVAGTAVAAAILAGNLLVYRNMPVTPRERFADLERLGQRYAGQGPALYPAFDEFAGYLMRDAKLTQLLDVPPEGLLQPQPGALIFSENLDAFRPAYLDTFALIVVRRGDPAQSRPPSNWRRVERTIYHDVYRRLPEAMEVVAHRGLPAGVGERPAGFCRDLRGAGAAARIAYAPPVDGQSFTATPEATPRPGGWSRATSVWQTDPGAWWSPMRSRPAATSTSSSAALSAAAWASRSTGAGSARAAGTRTTRSPLSRSDGRLWRPERTASTSCAAAAACCRAPATSSAQKGSSRASARSRDASRRTPGQLDWMEVVRPR